LEGNYFENCVFVQADFSDASDHGDTFERCVFLKCTFKLAVIGYDGSQFRNCLFRESGFQKTNFIRGEFVHTDFVNSRLRGIDFSASSFEDCNFEGLLDNVWFRGTFAYGLQVKEFGQPKLNTMLNVSSENADLRNLTFSNGCDLSTVKVKNNGRYFKYDDWYQRLQFLSKEMELWDDQKQRNEAAKFLKVSMVHAATQDWEILNLDDWEDFYGGREVISKIVESLNRFTNS
jgi:fluoroquinolone resistance protein